MSEKYIRENKNSYVISKSSKSYGKFQNLDDAMFARQTLIENDWDLDRIDDVLKDDDDYIVVSKLDGKIHFIARYKQKPSDQQVRNQIKRHMRNPNNSKYGLNITRIFETFIIKKRIAGEDYIFGYYDNLEDAEFVRNHLLENMWNVSSFSKVMYDEDHGNYKIVEIIDDKVYVIDSYGSEDEINIDESHEKFLSKISKHKFGLASHPYLDELKDEISQLEEMFGVGVSDENWNLEGAADPLNDIIFNLTPWQKIVYDAVDDSTLEEIEKSLQRYRSKNFTQKIRKNLDELVESGLISKNDEIYTNNK